MLIEKDAKNPLKRFKTGAVMFGVLGLLVVSPASSFAANISDAATCDTEVASAEKAIVRATLSANDLSTLVSLADQAKSACSENDFPKASKITTAISQKLAQVANN